MAAKPAGSRVQSGPQRLNAQWPALAPGLCWLPTAGKKEPRVLPPAQPFPHAPAGKESAVRAGKQGWSRLEPTGKCRAAEGEVMTARKAELLNSPGSQAAGTGPAEGSWQPCDHPAGSRELGASEAWQQSPACSFSPPEGKAGHLGAADARPAPSIHNPSDRRASGIWREFGGAAV